MPLFFPIWFGAPERAKPDWKKERLRAVRFTQGGGLGGLALGYYHTAPSGLLRPQAWPDDPKDFVVVGRTIGVRFGDTVEAMSLESCIPVIPSADLDKSLRFWVEGLGLKVEREMRQEGKLIGCMVHNGQHLYFWLNQRAGTPLKPDQYEGIRLYWAPANIHELRERLKQLGYAVSDLQERDYGQTEFFVTDEDGFSHCFGVPTNP